MLAQLGYVESLLLGAEVNILGGSGRQAQNVINYHNTWWNLPQAPVQVLEKARQVTSTKLLNGGSVQTLTASQTSVRGPHPERLLLDELDEIKANLFEAATGQTKSRWKDNEFIKAGLVGSSTFQNPTGTMKYVLDLAAEKGWPVYRWCYRETVEPHGWLTIEELESKRRDTPALMWQTEYELAEPAAGALAIDKDAVLAMFATDDTEVYEGRSDEYVEVEPPEAGGRYCTGADWARKVDKTAITTIRVDCTPARIVAFEQMNRRTWAYMIDRFITRLLRYGGTGNHDATGLGDIVAEQIRENETLVRAKVKVIDSILVGNTRNSMISTYVSAVEKGELRSPNITYLLNQHLYASRDDLYGARDEGHLPDGLCSAMLAWAARSVVPSARGFSPIGIQGATRW